MKKTIRSLPFIVLIMFSFAQASAQQVFADSIFDSISNSHDIVLSPWGPYSKNYAGISHLPDMQKGMRFDFSVLPGFYRNKVIIPNVQFESGYFPWQAAPDLKSFTYRYELEWKDQVFVDVGYQVVDSTTVLVKIRCVNQTIFPQNLALNLIGSIAYPDVYPDKVLVKSSNATWIHAIRYENLVSPTSHPKDNLVTDGLIKGEVRGNQFIEGSAIRLNSGPKKGDIISYKLNLKNHPSVGTLSAYYKMNAGTSTVAVLTGIVNDTLTLVGTGNLESIRVPYQLNGPDQLTLEFSGNDAVELNGLLFTPSGDPTSPEVVSLERKFTPELTVSEKHQTMVLKFEDIACHYGIRWFGNTDYRIRSIRNDELDIFFRRLVHNHTQTVLQGNDKGDYSNIFIRPVELQAKSEKSIYAVLSSGSLANVMSTLNNFDLDKNLTLATKSQDSFENILENGRKFEFSQKMARATLLNNIVYPIYTQGQYIRHFTPGKWWNSLYTWDSGFIALGLNEVNANLAVQCINAYTTPVGSQSAFIHHGSPVPTQFYAFYDLWNKTQSREMLAYFYPRLKQYYEFLSGRMGSSTTRTLKSQLLKTWDYFYNSGGWDDYPAQVEVHRQRAEGTTTPVINTTQQIRIAKLLRLAAMTLNRKEDLRVYDNDIRIFSSALQKYSWNKESGYFSYVTHDVNGNPVGHFKLDNMYDYNMGLDGVYPLLSGICNQDQRQTLLQKIFSEENMWTPSGICVVDQSAPYYKIDGYWNGAVWMPHQWFMWKTMLDLDLPDLAFKIADKGLTVYKSEVDETYYTFEHFLAASGRGAGWHQFSGLSTPVLSWFSAYYKPGTVTTGFEVWINSQSFNKSLSTYSAEIAFDDATAVHQRCVQICLNPNYRYQVTFNGKELKATSPYPGLLYIHLPATNHTGTLDVKRIEN